MHPEDEPVIRLTTPLSDKDVRPLRVGDQVSLSGRVYTARDAAHKRMAASIAAGQALPIPLEGQVIYYVGPAPARPGEVIGPAGPTTAGRVDLYTPQLLALGLKGMIGKGKRSAEVRRAIAEHGAVYFALVGGAAALIAEHIKQMDLIAYADLGTEAIYQLVVENLRMVVANDVVGGDLFEAGRARYSQESTA
jgi:fumarate hydratase subunit beta